RWSLDQFRIGYAVPRVRRDEVMIENGEPVVRLSEQFDRERPCRDLPPSRECFVRRSVRRKVRDEIPQPAKRHAPRVPLRELIFVARVEPRKIRFDRLAVLDQEISESNQLFADVPPRASPRRSLNRSYSSSSSHRSPRSDHASSPTTTLGVHTT